MRSRWLPVVLYVGCIFALSSIRRPPPGPAVPGIDKLVHLVEYGVLGWLAWRAWRPRVARRLSAGLLVVALGLGVGGADELYQHTVPGRTASAADVAADLAGVGLAVLVASRRRRRRP